MAFELFLIVLYKSCIGVKINLKGRLKLIYLMISSNYNSLEKYKTNNIRYKFISILFINEKVCKIKIVTLFLFLKKCGL